MEGLLPIINDLQIVFKNTGTEDIKLPEIVVTGAQSCGKSSVLESLVRKSFLPRGTGIVTRCPIIIQMHQVPPSAAEYCEIVLDSDETNGFHSNSIRYTDYDELQEAIEQKTKEVAGTNRGISKTPIIVRIYDSNVISLTVVDLPGMVKVATGDQPRDIEQQVLDMILHYIKNPNAIILAVCAGNQDLATSESLKVAKEVDPKGERTLAVVTKLDLLDKGVNASKELEGLVVPVKLGIIGVINRSQQDLIDKKSVEDALADEVVKLEAEYPMLFGRIGSVFLAKRLNQLLLDHIRDSLPDLKSRITALTNEQRGLLKKYGFDLPDNIYEKMRRMTEIVQNFETDYKRSIEDRVAIVGGALPKGSLAAGAQIGQGVLRYCDEIDEIDGLSDLEDDEIDDMIKRTTNWERFVSVEDVFKNLVKKQIYLLEKPCQKLAQQMHEVLQETVKTCTKEGRIPKLNQEIARVMRQLLGSNATQMEHIISSMFEEHSIMIFSRDEEFNELLRPNLKTKPESEFGSDGGSHDVVTFPITSQVSEVTNEERIYIKKLVQTYFNSVRKNVVDILPKKCMYIMYRHTMEQFHEAIAEATGSSVESIMVEPETVVEARKRCQMLIKKLNSALVIVNRIQDTDIE